MKVGLIFIFLCFLAFTKEVDEDKSEDKKTYEIAMEISQIIEKDPNLMIPSNKEKMKELLENFNDSQL